MSWVEYRSFSPVTLTTPEYSKISYLVDTEHSRSSRSSTFFQKVPYLFSYRTFLYFLLDLLDLLEYIYYLYTFYNFSVADVADQNLAYI